MKNPRLPLLVLAVLVLAVLVVGIALYRQGGVAIVQEDANPGSEAPQKRTNSLGARGTGGARVSVNRATLKGIVMWPGNVPASGTKIRLEEGGDEIAVVRSKGHFELPVLSRLDDGKQVTLVVNAPCWEKQRTIQANVQSCLADGLSVADLGVILLPDKMDCVVKVQLNEQFMERLRTVSPSWSVDVRIDETRVGGNPFEPIPVIAKSSRALIKSACSVLLTIPFRPNVQVHVWLKPDTGGTGLNPIYVSYQTISGNTRFAPSRLESNAWHLDLSTLGCLVLEAIDQNGDTVPEATLQASQVVLGKRSMQIRSSGFGREIIVGTLGSHFDVRAYVSGLDVGCKDKDLVVDNGRHKIKLDMSSRIQLIVTKDNRPLTRYHVGIPLGFNGKSSEHLPQRSGGRSWLYYAVGGEGGWFVVGWKGKKGYVEREFQIVEEGASIMEIDLDNVREPLMGEIAISFPKGRKLRIDIRRVHADSKGSSHKSMYHKLLVPFPGSTQRLQGVPEGRYELRVDSLRLAKFPNIGAGETDTGRRRLFKVDFEVRGGLKRIDVEKMLRDRGL